MHRRSLVGLGLAAMIVAACSSSAAEPTKVAPSVELATPTVPPSPTSTATPTTAPSPWTIALQTQGVGRVNTAGFLNSNFGMTGGYAGEVHYTTDGGKTWPYAGNQSMCRFGLDIVDENIAWHCGNGGVFVTTDGGKTWTAAGDLETPEPDQCRFLSFIDADIGWAATPGMMHATIDGGATWTKVELPPDAVKRGLSAIHRTHPTDGYVLDTTGTIWTTVNMGMTWKPVSLGLSADEKVDTADAAVAAMRFTSASVGLVVAKVVAGANPPRIVALRTSDAGATWKSETLAVDASLVNALYLSRDAATLTVYSSSQGITVFRYQA